MVCAASDRSDVPLITEYVSLIDSASPSRILHTLTP